MPADKTSQFQQIGHFARSHGVHGELLLISEYAVDSLLDQHPLLRYRDDRGDLVPARLEDVRKSEAGNRNAFFVKLFYIEDRHEAEQLKGKKVWVDREALDAMGPIKESVPYYKFRVLDEEQRAVGIVVNGFDTAAQQIIEIKTDDEEQILVPLVDEFIVEVDEKQRRLICRNLEMLKDL